MNSVTKVVGLALAFFVSSSVNAGWMFTLEGEPGSSDFTLSATGSYQNFGNQATGNTGLCCLRGIRTDTGSGWYAPTGTNWTGSGIFSSGAGTVSAVSGAVNFEVTGDVQASMVFDDVLQRSEVWWVGGGSPAFPVISDGDVVSIALSGSLDFTSDILFDDLNVGTFVNALSFSDTLTYVVRERGSAAVPAPATLALLGLGLLSLRLRRNK